MDEWVNARKQKSPRRHKRTAAENRISLLFSLKAFDRAYVSERCSYENMNGELSAGESVSERVDAKCVKCFRNWGNSVVGNADCNCQTYLISQVRRISNQLPPRNCCFPTSISRESEISFELL